MAAKIVVQACTALSRERKRSQSSKIIYEESNQNRNQNQINKTKAIKPRQKTKQIYWVILQNISGSPCNLSQENLGLYIVTPGCNRILYNL